MGMKPSIPILLIILLFFVSFLSPMEIEQASNSSGTRECVSLLQIVDSQTSVFYENLGQLGLPDSGYYGKMPGGCITFSSGSASIYLVDDEEPLTMSFVDANPVEPHGLDPSSYRTSYFLGERGSYVGIESFSTILYEDLWNGIDLYYISRPDGIKYEFHLDAGINPSLIKIEVDGLDDLIINDESVKFVKNKLSLLDSELLVYQEENQIESKFLLLDERTYGYTISNYDTSKPLVIDPLLFSTYIGGSYDDVGFAIKVDSEGYTYVTGRTWSSDFPIVNAYQEIRKKDSDCFVLKLDKDGNEVLYSTFVGGTGFDFPRAIDVDSNGNAYVTGTSGTSDFPCVNAFDDSYNGNSYTYTYHYDCFLFKLNSTGNGLDYSTYIGGTGDDCAYAIQVDSSGNATICGGTEGLGFPVTNGTHKGALDVFVLKMNNTGNGVIFSTLLGSTSVEEAKAIRLDTSDNIFIVGETSSDGFPTKDAYNDTRSGGIDGFVTKLNSSGSGLFYSTFFGGTSDDYATALDIDNEGNVYVAGVTESINLPLANPFKETLNGTMDAFVFSLNSTGEYLRLSTYLGGSNDDQAYGIRVDDYHDIYVTGMTKSSDYHVINAFSDTFGGGNLDIFCSKLNASGDSLQYSSYIGGSGDDGIAFGPLPCMTIDIDINGTAYLTGGTISTNFPTNNPYQSVKSGYTDVFVLSLPDYGDADNDSLSNYNETLWGTNTHSNDTDSDLIPDGWEIENGLNATLDDAGDDPDLDLLLNLYEYRNNTLPFNNDTDSDSLLDGVEVITYGTNPLSNDSEGDLMPDGWEVTYGLDPLTDDASVDSDFDNLTNYQEYLISTFPNNNDTDGDLMPDGWEYSYGLNPLSDDSELDPDNDGLSNIEEYEAGSNPTIDDVNPDIVSIALTPTEPYAGTPTVITINAYDHNGIAFVEVFSNHTGVETAYNATFESTNGLYRYTIPSQSNGTTITFHIRVVDIADNERISSSQSFTIAEEPPSTTTPIPGGPFDFPMTVIILLVGLGGVCVVVILIVYFKRKQ